MHAHILIVEDEPAIAELIAINLKHTGWTYQIASDAQAARLMVDERLPDLVLLDQMLPSESGLSLTKSWRAMSRTKHLPLIMLTARGEDEDIIKGLDAGADDYIVKPFSPQEVLARIRALLRRKAPQVSGEVIEIGALQLNPATHLVTWQKQVVKMGSTEFKLLNYLMSYPDIVHTRTQILNKVWGEHVFIEERTVDVHVKRLRAIFVEANIPDLIETVRGMGYCFIAKAHCG